MNQTANGRAELEAARLLLQRMGICPADLLEVRPTRPPAPTFAEYVPVVAAAVSPACRRAGALALRPRDLDTDQCLIFLREKGGSSRAGVARRGGRRRGRAAGRSLGALIDWPAE